MEPAGTPLGTPLGTSRPNVIMLLADDLDWRVLAEMEGIQRLFDRTFRRMIVSHAVCEPSRATFFTGRMAHNHGLTVNTGTYQGFRDQDYANASIGKWMQDALYRTIYIGKYFNGYQEADATTIPPGWDVWRGQVGPFWDHRISVQGVPESYAETSTERYANEMEATIRSAVTAGVPFFQYVSPSPPHDPPEFLDSIKNLFSSRNVPRPPNHNEKGAGEPGWLAGVPYLTDATVLDHSKTYRDRLRSMMGVRDMLLRLFGLLTELGIEESTYVFFTSDNGYKLGNHRISGKLSMFEEDIRVPLMVRGPDVAPGESFHLVGNHDLAPTFAELGGATPAANIDGRSIMSLVRGESGWGRRYIGIEGWLWGAAALQIPDWYGARSASAKIVMQPGVANYWFHLKSDPYELEFRRRPRNPSFFDGMAEAANAIRLSSGQALRDAEDGLL